MEWARAWLPEPGPRPPRWSSSGGHCPAALASWRSLAADTGMPAGLELSERGSALRLGCSGLLRVAVGALCGCVVSWDCSLGCGSIWTALLQAGLGGMCRLCLPGSHGL